MVYNFHFPTEWRNGVLISCNDCRLEIFKKVFASEKFECTKKNEADILTYIIGTLHYSINNWDNYPVNAKKKVMALLLNHGQFKKEEIEKIYKNNERNSDYPPEWEEELLKKGFSLKDIASYHFRGNKKIPEPINFSFPGYSCSALVSIGLCKQHITEHECPKCGFMVENTPENVDSLYNLMCPGCRSNVIESDIPYHHGYWHGDYPIIKFSGTDYLFVEHRECPEKGIMLPKGAWVDDRRLIISFKCSKCGFENVLKFKSYFGHKSIPIFAYDKHGKPSQLKPVIYKIFEAIGNSDESDDIEFKSTFYGVSPEVSPSIRQENKAKMKIVATICSFLNSHGGILAIGVNNDKEIIGLSDDFNYISQTKKGFENSPIDRFGLDLRDVLDDKIRNVECAIPHIKIDFETIPTGETVCVIEVSRSNTPIISKNNSLFVRLSNSTTELKDEKMKSYIQENFIEDID